MGGSANYTREEVMAFMKEKEKLEEEIKCFSDVLRSQGVGMDDPLVDAEGFPRSDIDVYQVRHARHDIRAKSNDLKACMQKIESGLHNLHAQAREGAGIDGIQKLAVEEKLEPFARVLVVTAGSPADEACIKAGDLVSRLGSVNATNFTSLKSIAEVVEHSRNRPLSVTVIRDGATLHLKLTPKPWAGQGLLGFKLRPVSIDADR